MSDLPWRIRWATLLRSFLIQGSWNYRTMQGGGFGFALLPVLRHLHGREGEALERALARHTHHFNAHPYLAGLGLGAVARLEVQGASPETIRRFKNAVRSSLGTLGDNLVWVAWLPTCLLGALALVVFGAGPALAVSAFLLAYNGGHLGLRIWGFRVGWEEGLEVAVRIGSAKLGQKAERVTAAGTLLLGLCLGGIVGRAMEPEVGVGVWVVLGVLSFVAGMAGGERVGILAVYSTGLVLGALFLLGMIH